ncbi:hypothetical protein HMPREF9278_1910 [Mobiluncus mulieris FB024-16]|nr:hypothetical protein HMPREF9278_1910 [Mobiluncus mulieris FB024-16]
MKGNYRKAKTRPGNTSKAKTKTAQPCDLYRSRHAICSIPAVRFVL